MRIMLTVIPGRGCLVRVWQCLRVAAILHLLMVLVRGVAVGGHYHTVPQGGMIRVVSIRRILSLLPVHLNITSLPFDRKIKSWTRGSLVSSDGWGQYLCRDGDRIGHITLDLRIPRRNENWTL